MLSAIYTGDEYCHGLICRSCLHLVIGTLALPAACAEELVRCHCLITLQLRFLPNLLLLEAVIPSGLKELICVHLANIIDAENSRLESRKEFCVTDIGFGAEICGNMTGMHEIEMRKEMKGPGAGHVAFLGFSDGAVVYRALELEDLLGR